MASADGDHEPLVDRLPKELAERVRHIARERGQMPDEYVICAVKERLTRDGDEVARRETIARIQAAFAHIPPDVSLVDELIAERRAEAEREARE